MRDRIERLAATGPYALRAPALALAGLSLLAWALPPAVLAQPGFSDRTEAAGIAFLYQPPIAEGLATMFGGGTVGDFDSDGWPDLFVLGGGLRPDALFLNDRDGTFTDVASAAGLDRPHLGGGASAADYDRDGDTDLYLTSFGDPLSHGSGRHLLYRNEGDGTFTEVAAEAGVNDTGATTDGMGSTWGDYDLDGDLDLFVAGWRPNPDSAGGNRLFRNDLVETGQAVFTDVTDQLGLFSTNVQAFGAIFADMNHDRYPELLVVADFGTSAYLVNRRDGTLEHLDGLLRIGGDKVHNGMGGTLGDFDRDGSPDWFVTSAYPAWKDGGSPGNFLYLNQTVAHGHELAALPEAAGVSDGGFGWGAAAHDFDHDGWTDIVMTNGWKCPDPVTGECFTNEPAYLFSNNGDLTFTEVGLAGGLEHRLQGRALLTFDYDRDGDMDVVILSNSAQGDGDPVENGELRLFRNELAGADRHWVEIVLDPSANPALAPHGLGSRVTVTAGGEEQHALLHGGSNYLGRSELIAHFGLGEDDTIEEIEVRWNDGFTSRLQGVAADQRLTVAAPLPYTHDPLRAGEAADLTVTGLEPGEVAHFAGNLDGPGDGRCPPRFGGLCSDLAEPTWILGSAVADATGTATLTITVPDFDPGTAVFSQAMIARGEGGILSLASNVGEGLVE